MAQVDANMVSVMEIVNGGIDELSESRELVAVAA